MNKEIIIPIGTTEKGNDLVCDLIKAPHIFIGGKTASGKSVFLHKTIKYLMNNYSTEEINLLLIDTKHIEFDIYNGLPHILGNNAVWQEEDITYSLKNLIKEMYYRYELFVKNNVVNFDEYNEKTKQALSRIIVIIDELVDIIYNDKTLAPTFKQLLSMGKACGFHFIIATQRPEEDIVPYEIIANIPTRIAFGLDCAETSKFIVGENGAEKLTNSGELLYKGIDFFKPIKATVPF